MQLSDFGVKITEDSGILQVMDDLGKAMAGADLLAIAQLLPAWANMSLNIT